MKKKITKKIDMCSLRSLIDKFTSILSYMGLLKDLINMYRMTKFSCLKKKASMVNKSTFNLKIIKLQRNQTSLMYSPCA